MSESRKLDGGLKAFFEQTYRPARLKATSRNHLREYRAAIRRVSELLNKPADLSDLTDGVLLAIKDKCDSDSRLIASIWRYAAKNALIDTTPGAAIKEPKGKGRMQTLVGYFEDVFYPVMRDEMSDATIKAYRVACTAYGRFTVGTGQQIIRSATPQRLKAFREWQIDIGISKKKATDRATFVRAVAKHADPTRWIKKIGKTPKLADDSLESVLHGAYTVAKPGLSKITLKQHQASIRRFGKFLGHQPSLGDLTDENISHFMRGVLDDGCAVRTANGYRSKILAVWNFAAKKQLVKQFCTVEKLVEPEAIPQAWSREELEKLFRACEEMPGNVCGVPAPSWWGAIHRVAWNTGERSGAIFEIRWAWIDGDGHLVIPPEYRKARRKGAFYQLKADTQDWLKAIREPKREKVFDMPSKDPVNWFYRSYKKLLERAGLEYVPHKTSLQKMRRSYASHIEAAGGDATKALMHGERATTERSYLDPRITGKSLSSELLFTVGETG